MKIKGFNPPSLSDVAKVPTPAGPGGVPVPYPNVGHDPASSFTGGVERRFSTRFLQGIEPRLKMAGLPEGAVKSLTQRFGAMDRTELDREGRVVDTLLGSSHPKQSMLLYDMLQKLGSAVTAEGHRAMPGRDGSWAILPKGKDGVTLPNKAGARHVEGNVEFVVAQAGQLLVGDNKKELAQLGKSLQDLKAAKQTVVLDMKAAVTAGKLSAVDLCKSLAILDNAAVQKAKQQEVANVNATVGIVKGVAEVGVAVAQTGATVGVAAATVGPGAALGATSAVIGAVATIIEQQPALLHATATLLDAMGMRDAGGALDQAADELSGSPGYATICMAAAILTVVAAVPETSAQLMGAMGKIGVGIARKQLSDADTERAALFSQIGKLGPKVYALTEQLHTLQGALDGQERQLPMNVINAPEPILGQLDKAAGNLADIRKILIGL